MGVVYKARQIKANRTVALKMILSGQLASADEIKRFQTELQEDLQPALAAAKSADPRAHVELTRAEWVCACVRKHLKELEGIDAE